MWGRTGSAVAKAMADGRGYARNEKEAQRVSAGRGYARRVREKVRLDRGLADWGLRG